MTIHKVALDHGLSTIQIPLHRLLSRQLRRQSVSVQSYIRYSLKSLQQPQIQALRLIVYRQKEDLFSQEFQAHGPVDNDD